MKQLRPSQDTVECFKRNPHRGLLSLLPTVVAMMLRRGDIER